MITLRIYFTKDKTYNDIKEWCDKHLTYYELDWAPTKIETDAFAPIRYRLTFYSEDAEADAMLFQLTWGVDES